MKKVKFRALRSGFLAAAFSVFLIFALSSCSSIKNAAFSSVSTALSGANKKGIVSAKKNKNSENNALLAITGERDVTLISEFFPTALVFYEMMLRQNPNHAGLAVMTGQLNIMYANAFVQSPADDIDITEFDRQRAEYERAALHYVRGRDYCLNALELRHAGLRDALFAGDEQKIAAAVAVLDQNDVAAAYWCGAGWLANFSLDPLNPDLLEQLAAPLALLEKAAALDPNYSDGAIWSVLFSFYVSAPEFFGGNYERGLFCYEEALRVSGGKNAGHYVSYAQSVCVAANDKAAFVEALEKALAIDADENPDTRLMTIISQNKAKKLLAKIDDYFLDW